MKPHCRPELAGGITILIASLTVVLLITSPENAISATSSLLKVERLPDGSGAHIQVFPSSLVGPGLLELLDARSGHCVRTLRAGSFSNGEKVSVEKGPRLPSGNYRVRYREGIALEWETLLIPAGQRKWLNPQALTMNRKAVYVLDCGIPRIPSHKITDGSTAAEVPATGETCLYKFLTDGKADETFGDQGRVILSDKPTTYPHSFMAVDEDGAFFMSSKSNYDVTSLDPSGDPTNQLIGGFAGSGSDPFSPKNTVWVRNVTVGSGKLIYIFSGCGMIRAYDSTQSGTRGFRYGVKTKGKIEGDCRSMTSDRRGAIFIVTNSKLIQKYEDTGQELKEGSSSRPPSKPSDKIYVPTGLSAAGDLIWVADHGPGPGPFWDSGGGHELVLFWDNEKELQLVERFGTPGLSAQKLQFHNPCATAMTPDHLQLWVAEDGLPNDDGPPGNARVRKFRITSCASEEIPLDL
jgi:hypothetical protein